MSDLPTPPEAAPSSSPSERSGGDSVTLIEQRSAEIGVASGDVAEAVKGRRIYLASSWRNENQPTTVKLLRGAGHEVYDFRNPAPGNEGFAWSEIDPDWLGWNPRRFIDLLDDPIAVAGFGLDFDAMQWADTFVLELPCGRSAHLEAGWAIGQGKPVAIIVREQGFEPELMYRMAAKLVCDYHDLLAWLNDLPPASTTRDFGALPNPDPVESDRQSRESGVLETASSVSVEAAEAFIESIREEGRGALCSLAATEWKILNVQDALDTYDRQIDHILGWFTVRLSSTQAALPPPESGSSGLGSASALEVEAGDVWLQFRERLEQLDGPALVRFAGSINATLLDEASQVGKLLDWVGVAGDVAPLSERVLLLCVEFVVRTKQMDQDEAFTIARDVLASATKPEASPSPAKSLKLGDDRVVWVDEPRLAALFHIAHCALSGLEGSEATEQAVDQNLDTADALRADLIKWIATAQTPLVSALGVGAGEGDWRESDVVKAARKTLTDYEGHPDYVPLPESQWAALLEGVLAERDFIGEWLQRMLDEAAGAESVHDAYDKGWSEAEAHFATTTAGAEWERAELWRSKANDMDSRLKLATAFVENAGPVVGNRAELLLILSGTTTTTALPSPGPDSSRPVSTDEEEGQ